MLLHDDQLVGILVETEAGERIGTLAGFVIDAESGIVVQYRVRAPGIVSALFPGIREMLVHHQQVISLDAQRMVIRGRPAAHARQRDVVVPLESPRALSSQPSSAALQSKE